MPNAVRFITSHSELTELNVDTHTRYSLGISQARGLSVALYQAPWVTSIALSTGAVNVGQIHYQPFRVNERSMILSSLMYRVTSLPTNPTKMMLAITSMNSNYQPVSYAAQYAEITISSTGSVELTGLNTTLSEGLYQVSYQVNNGLTLQCIRGGMFNTFVSSGYATFVRAFRAAHVYGTWPVTPSAWTDADTSTVGFENPFLLRFT